MSGEKKKTKDKIFEMTNESAQHRHEGNSKTHQGLKEISEIDKKKMEKKREQRRTRSGLKEKIPESSVVREANSRDHDSN